MYRHLIDLLNLTKQLFPKGSAFFIGRNSVKEKMHKGLSLSDDRFIEDSQTILWHILPDNEFFTEYDANLWEVRLGIIQNPLNTLEERKAAIIQKLNHPGNILARQSGGYIQDQLRLAGFDVYVHENPLQLTIEEYLGHFGALKQLGQFQLGQQNLGNVFSYYNGFFQAFQLGQFQLGQQQLGAKKWRKIVANKINQLEDFKNMYYSKERIFFVGGQTVGTFASVPQNREAEFRQLLLMLKPTKTIGVLLINYN